MAFQAPGPNQVDSRQPTSSTLQKASAGDAQKRTGQPPSTTNSEIMTAEEERKRVEDELASAMTLEKLRAEADLLEMRVAQQKTAIEARLAEVHDYSQNLEQDYSHVSLEQREQTIAGLKSRQEMARLRLEEEQTVYIKSRVELGRLKHQIRRAPKDSRDVDDQSGSLAEFERRLSQLERKVDRVLSLLPKKASR
jgi:hypothetical protein